MIVYQVNIFWKICQLCISISSHDFTEEKSYVYDTILLRMINKITKKYCIQKVSHMGTAGEVVLR